MLLSRASYIRKYACHFMSTRCSLKRSSKFVSTFILLVDDEFILRTPLHYLRALGKMHRYTTRPPPDAAMVGKGANCVVIEKCSAATRKKLVILDTDPSYEVLCYMCRWTTTTHMHHCSCHLPYSCSEQPRVRHTSSVVMQYGTCPDQRPPSSEYQHRRSPVHAHPVVIRGIGSARWDAQSYSSGKYLSLDALLLLLCSD